MKTLLLRCGTLLSCMDINMGIWPSRCFSACASAAQEVDVVIALGTNMGNRGLNLHRGLQRLRQLGVQVLRHSALYETAAAYVTDQPSFLNAAVLARTRLPPVELLRVLKQVEAEAGRDLVGGQRFGPRLLDLDIVFYGAGSYRDGQLDVPHPRWRERPFVQAPVSDLLYRRDTTTAGGRTGPSPTSRPETGGNSSGDSGSCWGNGGCGQWGREGGRECASSRSSLPTGNSNSSRDSGRDYCSYPLPAGSHGSVIHHLRCVRDVWCKSLRHRSSSDDGGSSSGMAVMANGLGGSCGSGGEVIRRVTQLINLEVAAPSGGSACLSWGARTYLMAILNVTPDSFSDGGRHSGSVEAAVVEAEAMVAEGADIIDVGGQSTRPGAVRLSPQEELARVMPVLRALRSSPRLRSVPVSVDTFYSEVAREAVTAGGANIVNDVSGGAADVHMLPTVAELGVPYILMHMRGDPSTMTRSENTSYGSSGVWRKVGSELLRAAEVAEALGVAAWNIILDPGIGFAKDTDDNLELLRNLAALRRDALDGPYANTAGQYDTARAGGGDGDGCGGVMGGVSFSGPLLVGPSRKRFLGAVTGRQVPEERDAATVAACVVCVAGGADLVRVHSVRGVRDALRVADAVYRYSHSSGHSSSSNGSNS